MTPAGPQGWRSVPRLQITLGEWLGGFAVLTAALAWTLPGAGRLVEAFGPENAARLGRLIWPHVALIVIAAQVFYWMSLVPLLRWWRGRRRR